MLLSVPAVGEHVNYPQTSILLSLPADCFVGNGMVRFVPLLMLYETHCCDDGGMGRRMDGWMRWMHGWMRWMHGWMHGCLEGCMNGYTACCSSSGSTCRQPPNIHTTFPPRTTIPTRDWWAVRNVTTAAAAMEDVTFLERLGLLGGGFCLVDC